MGVLAKANCAMQPAHGDHAKPNAFIAMPAGDVPLSLLHAMEDGSTLMVYPDGCTSTTGVMPDAWCAAATAPPHPAPPPHTRPPTPARYRVQLAPMDAVVCSAATTRTRATGTRRPTCADTRMCSG